MYFSNSDFDGKYKVCLKFFRKFFCGAPVSRQAGAELGLSPG